MAIDFQALANASVRHLPAYQPGTDLAALQREKGLTSIIKLASNENQLGVSPFSIRAMTAAIKAGNLYPDASCYQLKCVLAEKLKVQPNQLVIAAGSEQILDLIVRCYLRADDSAVLSQYAFMVIPLLLQACGVVTKMVPTQHWQDDIPKLIKAIDTKTRVLFLVNPNNPTGTYTNEKNFIELMESIPQHVLVVVDEAYHEYVTQADYPQTIKYLAEYPNLIITRTFSKIYGLAGLRVGYAIASPTIIDILQRVRSPFAVNALGLVAAEAALHDLDFLMRSLDVNREGLRQLQNGLKALNLNFLTPTANFIMINVGNGPLSYEKLWEHGIIVRPLLPYNLPHHIRVTVGTYEQNESFLTAMKTLIAEKIGMTANANHLTEEVTT